MSDKARGALFNVIGDIEGLAALDAFAGSGALGLEALSRSAAHVTFIDNDRAANQTMNNNAETLGLTTKTKITQASISAWLDTNKDTVFDLVLCDPPYDNLQPNVVISLSSVTKKNGLFVLSWPPNTVLPELPELTLLEQRRYGDATLVFYRRIG
jgi:16S rRNA (guanine966-N2)-methyltransferase